MTSMLVYLTSCANVLQAGLEGTRPEGQNSAACNNQAQNSNNMAGQSKQGGLSHVKFLEEGVLMRSKRTGYAKRTGIV
jgi:hypothetical protein